MKSNSVQYRSSERLKTLSNTAGSMQKSRSMSPQSSKSSKVSTGDPRRSPRLPEKSVDSLKNGPKSSGIKRKVLAGAPGDVKRLKDSDEKSTEDLDAERHLPNDANMTEGDDFVDNEEGESWGDATTEEDDDAGNHQVAVLESESKYEEVEFSSELEIVSVSLEESKTDAVNDCFNSGSELELDVTTDANGKGISFNVEDQAIEVDDDNSVNSDNSSEGATNLVMPSQSNHTLEPLSGNTAPGVYFREIQGEGNTPMIQQPCSCGRNQQQRNQSEEENEFRIFLALVLLKFILLMCELIAAIM